MICDVCAKGRHELCDEEDQRVPHHCDCKHEARPAMTSNQDAETERYWLPHGMGFARQLKNPSPLPCECLDGVSLCYFGEGCSTYLPVDDDTPLLTGDEEVAEHLNTLEQSLAQERQQNKPIYEGLRSLLAVIHRDGGHYFTDHGLDKAVEDAQKVVHDERQQREAAEAARDNWKEWHDRVHETKEEYAHRFIKAEAERDALREQLDAAREVLKAIAEPHPSRETWSQTATRRSALARAALSEPQRTAE